MQESPLFQNGGCSWGEAPRQVLQGLDWAPGSRGRKRHGSFNDEKWVFFTSPLKVCCCFTSRQRRDVSSKGLGQAAELEKAAPQGPGLRRSSPG